MLGEVKCRIRRRSMTDDEETVQHAERVVGRRRSHRRNGFPVIFSQKREPTSGWPGSSARVSSSGRWFAQKYRTPNMEAPRECAVLPRSEFSATIR